jgi:hypothetical protein
MDIQTYILYNFCIKYESLTNVLCEISFVKCSTFIIMVFSSVCFEFVRSENVNHLFFLDLSP